ncbi:MAG: hypothetical protein ACOCVA_03395 [Prolixibacteraceae bacterium]
MKLKKPTNGEPKWDWIVIVRVPLDFKKWGLEKIKVGKGFLKRLLKKINIEL